jgi:hypothetical protein
VSRLHLLDLSIHATVGARRFKSAADWCGRVLLLGTRSACVDQEEDLLINKSWSVVLSHLVSPLKTKSKKKPPRAPTTCFFWRARDSQQGFSLPFKVRHDLRQSRILSRRSPLEIPSIHDQDTYFPRPADAKKAKAAKKFAKKN